MSILHHDAPGVNADSPSTDDVRWWAGQNRDWHDQFVVKECGDDDYDCVLDFEAGHEQEVNDWFRRRRWTAGITSGDERPDEADRWNGHPG
jgi:hypothetical protein